MRSKGFTLVEVLIVVIIIGILAAIGIPQFSAAMEKAKGGEARAGLGHIQTAEKIYFAENDAYIGELGDTSLDSLPISALDLTLTQKYWTFTIDVPGENEDGGATGYTATATRKGGSTAYQNDTIMMDNTGEIGGTWDFIN
ncbi:MAG: type IV pilin protein [Candidatus Gorgyraea atricola]|nr:type IV pilin protein [Candidatus Gorgyraea atricola]